MNTQLKPTRRGYWTISGSSGVGPTNVEIVEKYNALGNAINQTTQGQERLQALRNLIETFSEARKADWDGYGATPISPLTFQWATGFLQALPDHLTMPEIMAHPDGDLSFEWYRDPQHTIVVAIDERGVLHYAALFGAKSSYGTDHFAGELPDEILRQIHRHMADTE